MSFVGSTQSSASAQPGTAVWVSVYAALGVTSRLNSSPSWSCESSRAGVVERLRISPGHGRLVHDDAALLFVRDDAEPVLTCGDHERRRVGRLGCRRVDVVALGVVLDPEVGQRLGQIVRPWVHGHERDGAVAGEHAGEGADDDRVGRAPQREVEPLRRVRRAGVEIDGHGGGRRRHRPARGERLDAMVVGVCDVEVPSGVDAGADGLVELRRAGAVATPHAQERSVSVEGLDPVVERVDHVDGPRAVDRDAIRRREPAVSDTDRAQCRHERARRSELLDPVVPRVGDVHLARPNRPRLLSGPSNSPSPEPTTPNVEIGTPEDVNRWIRLLATSET